MKIKDTLLKFFKIYNKPMLNSYLSKFHKEKIHFDIEQIITEHDLKNELTMIGTRETQINTLLDTHNKFIDNAEVTLIIGVLLFLVIHPFLVLLFYLFVLFLVANGHNSAKAINHALIQIENHKKQIQPLNDQERSRIKQICSSDSICHNYIKSTLTTGRTLVKGDLLLLEKHIEIKNGLTEYEINSSCDKILEQI